MPLESSCREEDNIWCWAARHPNSFSVPPPELWCDQNWTTSAMLCDAIASSGAFKYLDVLLTRDFISLNVDTYVQR